MPDPSLPHEMLNISNVEANDDARKAWITVALGACPDKRREADLESLAGPVATILKTAFDKTASSGGFLLIDINLGEDVKTNTKSLLSRLKQLGILKAATVQRGFFDIQGYALTTKGERLLDQIEGRDTKTLEQGLHRRIMLKLLAAEKVRRGDAVIQRTPFSEDAGQVGPERMASILKVLAHEGFLEEKRRGPFNMGGYYALSNKGRDVAEELSRGTVKPLVKARTVMTIPFN
ncbi:MAG: hypothetical protein PHD48_09060 [Alphaproteobacteria bacterium]|nr:hypothetical protein [Alphaproteobacteria bacterium]